jgi:phosphatidylserine/phosphatidylglycerophosphate/cardiolipin synthase-like enzyme
MKIHFLAVFLLVLTGCIQNTQEDTDIQPYFCPRDMCEERTIMAIESAKNSIDIAMYSFTSDSLAKILEEKSKKGIKVRIVADYLQSNSKYSDFNEMKKTGIEIRFAPKNKVMHNKFAIIDEETVLTGSYNWTKNANTSNFENFVLIKDKKTAKEYEKEFFNIWIQSE